jgi:ATP-dependent DNA helicase RecQ
MTLRTVMALLERAGLIQRELDPGSRHTMTEVVDGADLSALEDQLKVLDEKRRRDQAKLTAMLAYVDGQDCRHAHILRYFGEPDASPSCTACDRCCRERETATRAVTEPEWDVVQKVLSCAARLKGRFGVARLAQVLMGSKAKPILERGLDDLPTYGLLRGHSESYVRAVIDALVEDGSLGIPPGEYPVVELTRRGREVMWRRVQPRVLLPDAQPKVVASAKKREPAQGGRVDAELLRTLRKWRAQTARAQSVPAYVVMHNKALDAIAIVQPHSLAELEAVRGMGPVSVEKYGDAILAILDEHGG